MNQSDDLLVFPRSSAQLRTLSNGLEVIVQEDHSAPVVSLQIWCRAGSVHEREWLGAGMSHYLEHMLFKGTTNRGGNEVAQTVQELGGYINAYTSFDRTVYWIDAPSSGAVGCLDVLCDVVANATLPPDEFEKEREVIRREIAMGEDNPDSVLSKMLFHNLFMEHPCRHPVIGHLDVFNQLSRDDLYQYYKAQYSPENLFVVVAGDVRADDIFTQVNAALGEMVRQPREAVAFPQEPHLVGTRCVSETFPTDLYRTRFGWIAPDVTHPDVPALDILASVLGGGRSSRFYQSIRESQGLAHSISAYAYTPSFGGLFAISYDCESKQAEDTERAIFEELEKVWQDGVEEGELAKATRQALSSQFAILTSMRAQASDIGSNWILTRNLDFTRDYVQKIQDVSLSEVKEVAQRYLARDGYARVSLTPEEENSADQSQASSQSAGKRSEDIRKFELENGLTVLLLADHRVPFVQATGAFRGGLLAEQECQSGITRLMGRLLTKDTQKRSGRDLADAIESVGGSIGGSIGNNTFGVSAGALRSDLDLVIDLLGETLLEPAFLAETLEREKDFQISSIKAEADRPFAEAMKRLRRELYGEHPYGFESSGTPQSVGAIQRTDLLQHYQNLVRGKNGVLGVFGDLDLARAEDLIRHRFSESLSKGECLFSSKHKIAMPASLGQQVDLSHEKEQAILLIAFRTVDLTHPDNAALEMIDEACSDMASRMFIRIREELGLAYSVGAMRMLGLEPGFLAFYCATAPEKIDLVQKEMLDEIEKIATRGLLDEELQRAKASWIGRDAIHLQSAKRLAEVATIDELVGLGWDNYRHNQARIEALENAQIQSVAEKYLCEKGRVIVRLF